MQPPNDSTGQTGAINALPTSISVTCKQNRPMAVTTSMNLQTTPADGCDHLNELANYTGRELALVWQGLASSLLDTSVSLPRGTR